MARQRPRQDYLMRIFFALSCGYLIAVSLDVSRIMMHTDGDGSPGFWPILNTTLKPRSGSEESNMAPLLDYSRDNCNVTRSFLIGFGKCGTTALLEFLAGHPQLLNMGMESYFDESNRFSFKRYLKRRKCIFPTQVRMSKLGNKVDIKKLYTVYPDVKLVMIVCEPVRRFISAFTHAQMNQFGRVTQASVLDFENELDRYFRCLTYKLFCYKPRYFIDYNSVYRDWLAYFFRDQIKIIDGDLFRKQPLKYLKELESYLGVRSYFNESQFVFNPHKGFFCKKDKKAVNCMGPHKGRKHPKISEYQRKRLKEFYEPYNQQFSELSKRTFKW